MSNLAFLDGRAWMDEDGYHVWLAHEHKGNRIATMLPHPSWKAVDGRLVPSFSCDCGAHFTPEIGSASAEDARLMNPTALETRKEE